MGFRLVRACLLLIFAAVLMAVGTAGTSEPESMVTGFGPTNRGRRTLLQIGTDRGRFPDCSRNASTCLDPKLTPDGPTCCFGRCFNIQKSINHCGACGRVCGYRQTCCSGRCVNLMVDELNCGRCDVVCDDTCENGICGYST